MRARNTPIQHFTAATFSTLFFVLLWKTGGVNASNPFNWTPSVSLLDGSGEVNKNGFCLRIEGSLEDDTLDCNTILGSTCLPDALGTQFGYNELDNTIYAVNVTCSSNDNDDATMRSCLTAEAPIMEGNSLIVTECNYNDTTTKQQQTFTYTSSGKFLVDTGDDSNATLCLGMNEYIWQQGAHTPYVDPTFWRELTLMDCNATDSTLITWLVSPMPMTVLDDGPFPELVVEDEELDLDDIMLMIDDLEDYNDMNITTTSALNITSTSSTSNHTTESTLNDEPDITTSVAKKTGNVRRILDEAM